ncbi:MAG: HAD-IC family P-type ATPase [Deltaproteobacteria bacterium]|nr:HAD-IC family P-type ATPase [Deltaproteobacteria bacterium]
MNNEKPIPYHTLPPEEVLKLLETTMGGLPSSQVQERLERFGYNELAAAPGISPLRIFFRQFKNLLIVILLIATAISFLLGEHLDAWVILGILAACAILGFYQEYTAEQAALALKKMAAPTATVIREGKEAMIPTREVAPGDILALHAGDRVAADGRLLSQFNLMADEAALTGESTPVAKKTNPLTQAEAPLGDRFCMVFGGTMITYGRGLAVVTATGMNSEFGRIARILAEVEEKKTPLEARMDTIGRVLSVIALAVAAAASILGVFRGHSWLEMLIWGISLAVAAVPEALPAVVTGALSIGTTRMARRNAIVKRLPAVETMGCITVICTDKTGTLTRNEMVARRVFLEGRELEVTGNGYEPSGVFLEDGRELAPDTDAVLQQAARIALFCNDASLEEEGGEWQLRGDPTEGALLALGRKGGLDPVKLAAELPRVGEIPFAAERQMMTTIHREQGRVWAYVKGAPERVLDKSPRILTREGERALTEADRRAIMDQAGKMAGEALRVLGLAYRTLAQVPEPEPELVEKDLVWVGLAGLMDPPRAEAAEAVALCHQAGIRVIMVTGDHPITAGAVAREVGLVREASGVRDQGPGKKQAKENIDATANCRVITGAELNRLSDEELKEVLKEVRVFARVAPEHKLRLVKVLKEQGEIVAMTGDGVNDAPALKRADIGVAMGITGTEVTKETAAMILADDNFATLVAAVEEGRAIFDNIKKYLIFLLSCNLAEIFVLTGAFFMGMPLPLVVIQILMVNLTTDGLPALALGVDPKAPDIMQRPPRSPREGVFTRSVNVLLGVIPGYMFLTLVPLFIYYIYWNPGGHDGYKATLTHAQTMVFVGFVLFEMVNAFNCRHDYHSLFTVGFFRNRFLVAAVVFSLLIIVAVVQWPPLARMFHTAPLSLQDWLLAGALSLTLFPVVEAAKWFLRRRMEPNTRLQSEGGTGFPACAGAG